MTIFIAQQVSWGILASFLYASSLPIWFWCASTHKLGTGIISYYFLM